VIRYDAKLVDGSVFDSTKFHDNEPFASGLASLVPALAEGLQLIGIRGKIMIVSPPERAFGSQAQVGVPGDSVIIFEVQLIEVDGHR
jgi:FKBP-type peptidyl-prolyl cis-trans isomerase FkpA